MNRESSYRPNGPTLDSAVAKRFGRAPYYLLVDTATREPELIDKGEHDDEPYAIIPHMAGRGVEIFITGKLSQF